MPNGTKAPVAVPTPYWSTCPTPGTYTYPAKTVTVDKTTTVVAAATTEVCKGTYTLGGYTTTVDKPTTVTFEYAAEKTKEGGYEHYLTTTTYVCPSAGAYTVGPVTKTVTEDTTTLVYPVVTSYCPGTYAADAVTTTVTDDYEIIYRPYTSVGHSDSPSAYPTAHDGHSAVKYPTAKFPSNSSYPTYPTSTPAAYPTATPVPQKPAGGKKLTYTPYNQAGSCKGKDEILGDLTKIHGYGFDTVRVYSTDCDALPNIGDACRSLGMKMIIGVFVGQPGCDNNHPHVQQQIQDIKDWAQWDLVTLALVGNEAGHNNYCTPGQLKSLILQVKDVLHSGGCNVPVTTADTVDVWQRPDFSAEICPVVDVVAINSHAYFDAGVSSDRAGEFVKGQLQIVKEICGKDGYVVETGWPSAGKVNGLAVPSKEDQSKAIASLYECLGNDAVYFSYEDDHWKEPGECGCEQSWGICDLFGVVL